MAFEPNKHYRLSKYDDILESEFLEIKISDCGKKAIYYRCNCPKKHGWKKGIWYSIETMQFHVWRLVNDRKSPLPGWF